MGVRLRENVRLQISRKHSGECPKSNDLLPLTFDHAQNQYGGAIFASRLEIRNSEFDANYVSLFIDFV